MRSKMPWGDSSISLQGGGEGAYCKRSRGIPALVADFVWGVCGPHDSDAVPSTTAKNKYIVNNWRAENQSGLSHKLENALKRCFRSCWKLTNFKILAICSHWRHIFYDIFRQFEQFPVLDFELGYSGSRPFNYSYGTYRAVGISHWRRGGLHWGQTKSIAVDM